MILLSNIKIKHNPHAKTSVEGGFLTKFDKTRKLIIKQTENEVKKAVKEYLEFNGWTVYRINNSGTYRGKNKDGKDRYSFAGDPGVFDLYCLKIWEYPMWIETKATGKKLSEDQERFMLLVNSAPYGRAFWCDSFDMFLPLYNDIKNGYGLPKKAGFGF